MLCPCTEPIRKSKAKPNSSFFPICFLSHFVSSSSRYPRNLLLGWENKDKHKSHLSSRCATCKTLCRGKGNLQVTMWKPGCGLYLILPPRDKELPPGALYHPAEEQRHPCSLCCPTSGQKPGLCESPAWPIPWRICHVGSLPHSGICCQGARQGERGRAGHLLLQLLPLARKAK